jgi:hypothetical protein
VEHPIDNEVDQAGELFGTAVDIIEQESTKTMLERISAQTDCSPLNHNLTFCYNQIESCQVGS